nr:ferrous iron transport protein A [uncultured Cohaesibacter sp.]
MTNHDQIRNCNNLLTLNDIPPGSRVRVKRHNATGPVRQRLLDLGVMPNASILVVRAAPLNDPIELRLDATDITLRRREAATIEVTEDHDD